MDPTTITRKEFFKLTFTLVGGGALAGIACSSNSSSNNTDGSGGASCTDPLPEAQEADSTGHFHTITIHASVLSATTDQSFTTSVPMPAALDGHMHMITLTPAQLGTLKAGGAVTGVTSTAAGTIAHTHMFDISCHATTSDGGTDSSSSTDSGGAQDGANGG
jgi:hypothetical protein